MRRLLTAFIAICLLTLGSMLGKNKVEAVAPSDYGIYGTIYYASTSNGVVQSATVRIYKKVNGSWVSHGSTTASACGYYTYDTGGGGDWKVEVQSADGSRYIRYVSCGAQYAYEPVDGFQIGSNSWFTPYKQIDVIVF